MSDHYHVNIVHFLVVGASAVLFINLGRIGAGMLAKQQNPIARKAGAIAASVL